MSTPLIFAQKVRSLVYHEFIDRLPHLSPSISSTHFESNPGLSLKQPIFAVARLLCCTQRLGKNYFSVVLVRDVYNANRYMHQICSYLISS